MNKRMILALTLAVAGGLSALAEVRVNVNLGVGHPLRRPGRTVIVHRAPPAGYAARVQYAPPVVWANRNVVNFGRRDRMIFEDRETIRRRDDWVDTYFNVNNRGEALYFRVNGRAQIDFAEVTFRNGQTQVVDFNEAPIGNGTYTLLDFRDGRQVEGVRMVARSQAPQSTIAVLMRK
jgi:hypothetical protein